MWCPFCCVIPSITVLPSVAGVPANADIPAYVFADVPTFAMCEFMADSRPYGVKSLFRH